MTTIYYQTARNCKAVLKIRNQARTLCTFICEVAETNQWKSSSKKVDHLSFLNAVHPYPHPPQLQSSSTRFQNHVISVLEAGEGGITGHQSGDMPWIWLRPGEGPVSSLRLVIDA